jgi:hypothetical protein
MEKVNKIQVSVVKIGNLHGVRAAHGTLNPLVRVRISVEVNLFYLINISLNFIVDLI